MAFIGTKIVSTGDIGIITEPDVIGSKPDIDTLILFDIDLTLVKPSPSVPYGGAPLWDWILEKTKENDPSLSNSEAITKILPLTNFLNTLAQNVPVDTSTSTIIHQLRERNIKIIACSARDPSTEPEVRSTLKEVSFDDSTTDDAEQSAIRLNYVAETVSAIYTKNVILSGRLGKGVAIERFLSITHLSVTRIILVDDLMQNHHEMAKTCSTLGLSYIGVHYTAANIHPMTDQEAIPAMNAFFEQYPQYLEDYSYLVNPFSAYTEAQL